MTDRRPLHFRFSTLVVLVFAACSSTNPADKNTAPAGTGPADYKSFCDLPIPCQEITQACHPKDTGAKSQIHDCHLTGHTVGTLAACSKDRDLCLQVCGDAPPLSDGAVEDLGASCRDQ